jgi:hypothetical protein
MSDRILLSTRKGAFEFRRETGGWTLARESFLGSPVMLVLEDPRDAALYASINLGHFGHKMHRSADGGASWTEIPAQARRALGRDHSGRPLSFAGPRAELDLEPALMGPAGAVGLVRRRL